MKLQYNSTRIKFKDDSGNSFAVHFHPTPGLNGNVDYTLEKNDVYLETGTMKGAGSKFDARAIIENYFNQIKTPTR